MTELVYDWRRCPACHRNTYIRAGMFCCIGCIIRNVVDCMREPEPYADPIVIDRDELDYMEQDQ